jgi:hypothetical protein
MSFPEKNAWACFGALLVVYLPYFSFVLRQPLAFPVLFIVAVVALVVLLAAFHTINAIATRRIRQTGETPQEDEMDRQIATNAGRFSGAVLAVLVLIWCLAAMFGMPASAVQFAAKGEAFAVPVATALLWVHALFGGFVAANLAYYGRMIISYRAVAHG